MSLDYLAHLRIDSARFAQLLRDADPAAPVPSCPDWTAADLVHHLAEVQTFWGSVVRDRLDRPDSTVDPPRPGDYVELLALFEAASADLVRALSDATDDEKVWTWLDADQSVGFVRRRQAHEALVHRVDAELTAGLASELDAELASDGVAEVLEWMFGGAPAWAEHRVDGAVGEVVTTDTGRRWLVQLGRWSGLSPNSGTQYTDEPSVSIVEAGAPTFSVSGPAAALDLWLWNRPPSGQIVRTGDLSAFDAVIRSGVQ